ncbi:hypothetical protein P7C71_g5923, partial [Lecanoromycetidae sp. Uapishka_2]
MKLSAFLLLCFSAIPLVISARPVGAPNGLQQVLGTSPKPAPPSSVNSFSSSSDLESNSDDSTKSKKFSLSSFGNSLKKLAPKPTSEFRCHRYPKNSILSELSGYVTNLLRRHRENVLGGTGGQDHDLIPETCYAGYESTEVSPSIYFKALKPRQKSVVEKLFRNYVVAKFPNVKIVTTSNALAIVLEERPGLKRRNTV